MKKVNAFIASYNEAETLGNVLEAALASPLLNRVTVINSGSTDETAQVLEAFRDREKIEIITLQQNKGKTEALRAGIKGKEAEVFLFLDADLIGLSKEYIAKILRPVLEGKAVMSVGLKGYRGWFISLLMKYCLPLLGGERAIIASHFRKVLENKLAQGFTIETLLNIYCRRHKLPVAKVILPKLAHISKMKKQGFIKGIFGNLKMFLTIFLTHLRLIGKEI